MGEVNKLNYIMKLFLNQVNNNLFFYFFFVIGDYDMAYVLLYRSKKDNVNECYEKHRKKISYEISLLVFCLLTMIFAIIAFYYITD